LVELFLTPDNPVPATAWVGAITTIDGVQLRVARWKPVRAKNKSHQNRGTVCIVQGRAECIEFYFETIDHLRKRGFHVVTFDFRGQGGSQRLLSDTRKGHIRDFADYGIDMQTVIEQVLMACPAPYYALAHSTGAAVLLQMAHQNRLPFERMVLVTPNIQIKTIGDKAWPYHLVRLMMCAGMGASYVPTGGATAHFSRPFEGNLLTSDHTRYRRNGAILEAYPHLAIGDPTNAWLAASLRCGHVFADPAYAHAIRTPLLMVAGVKDNVVSTRAMERFSASLPAGHMVKIVGARHSLLAETDTMLEAFWRAFDVFIGV
jgi:lysophospholipase